MRRNNATRFYVHGWRRQDYWRRRRPSQGQRWLVRLKHHRPWWGSEEDLTAPSDARSVCDSWSVRHWSMECWSRVMVRFIVVWCWQRNIAAVTVTDAADSTSSGPSSPASLNQQVMRSPSGKSAPPTKPKTATMRTQRSVADASEETSNPTLVRPASYCLINNYLLTYLLSHFKSSLLFECWWN